MTYLGTMNSLMAVLMGFFGALGLVFLYAVYICTKIDRAEGNNIDSTKLRLLEKIFTYFLILIISYGVVGLVYAIVFVPLIMGVVGLVILVILIGFLLYVLLLDHPSKKMGASIIIISVISFLLGLLMLNFKITIWLGNANLILLGEIFEWFFGLLFVACIIIISFHIVEEKAEKSGILFIVGIGFIVIFPFIVFIWFTSNSIAVSICWIASGIALIVPSLFVALKDIWDGLHEEKWSSIITSILAAFILIVVSGNKFTPGIWHLINSSIAIGLSIALILAYYIHVEIKLRKEITKYNENAPKVSFFEDLKK